MLASANQMSVAYGMVCQVLSWKVAIYTLCVCVWLDSVKEKMARKESNNESFKWLGPLLQARSVKL